MDPYPVPRGQYMHRDRQTHRHTDREKREDTRLYGTYMYTHTHTHTHTDMYIYIYIYTHTGTRLMDIRSDKVSAGVLRVLNTTAIEWSVSFVCF